jgi:hypothetical protein
MRIVDDLSAKDECAEAYCARLTRKAGQQFSDDELAASLNAIQFRSA